MRDVQVVRVGNSMGFVLPREICEAHRIRPTDEVHLVPANDGGVRMYFYNPYYGELKAPEVTSRVVQSGGSYAVVISKVMHERLGIHEPGDRLHAVRMQDGLLLLPWSAAHEEIFGQIDAILRADREMLHALGAH